MLTYTKKWRWTLTGALIGFLIVWIDLFVEWRPGASFADWTGTGIGYNLGQFFGAMLFTSLIGLIAGAVSDGRASKKGLLRTEPTADRSEKEAFMEKLGVVGRLGFVLYWLGAGVAVVCAVGALAFAVVGNANDRWFFSVVLAIISVSAFLIGVGCRFILAGPKPTRPKREIVIGKPPIWRPILLTAVIASLIAGGRVIIDHYRDPLPGLWGYKRTQFVDGAFSSCERTQRLHPENKGLQPEFIRSYCKCYAEGMADRISLDDLKAARPLSKEQQQNWMLTRYQTTLNELAGACSSNVQR